MNVLSSIEREFSIFAYGEGHILEYLEKYPFDQEGMQAIWAMFQRLSGNVLSVLRSNFQHMPENWRIIVRDLPMSRMRALIQRRESIYRCYQSLLKTA
jgi:hypothetical protein